MKSSIFALFVCIFICSILTTKIASSVSFPNPPPFPPANATAEEWAQFMKFLHNYYAIIARPRFGKRLDSGFVPSDRRPLYSILRRNSERSSPALVNQWNEFIRQDESIGNPNALNFDDLLTDLRRR